MAIRLDTTDDDFDARFQALLAVKRENAPDITRDVEEIIGAVRDRGDAAVIEYTARFDHIRLNAQTMQVRQAEMVRALKTCDREILAALDFAYQRIKRHHRRQLPADDIYTDALGVTLGHRWRPIEAVGLYVPGGRASYPSSVLMNAVPAKIAGVPRIVMTVPAPNGVIDPLVLAAADLAGVDTIYKIGGAQAIAALAYGTQTISPVAKIVGPGNAYVTAAKRLVFGAVGIDSIAGPSEVLILADQGADAAWIAADLLAQAEHDPAAQAILITDHAPLAAQVARAVDAQLSALPKAASATASWRDFGAIIVTGTCEEALALIDAIAPEHLEIFTGNADALAAQVQNAGAIFIGQHTPEAIGDYVAGTNHVLPTARSARYSSALSVMDFMKRTSIVKCGARALSTLAPAAMALAQAEGLDAHRLSLARRISGKPEGDNTL